MATQIGVFHKQSESLEHVQYETACNYAKIKVLPGDYPVYADHYWIWVSYTGTIVEDFYVNRLFSATSSHRNENVGKTAHSGWQVDRWGLDRLIDNITPLNGVDLVRQYSMAYRIGKAVALQNYRDKFVLEPHSFTLLNRYWHHLGVIENMCHNGQDHDNEKTYDGLKCRRCGKEMRWG